MSMRPSLRISGHLSAFLRSRRSVHTVQEPSAKTYPLQVGGTHYQEGDRVIVIHKDGKRVKTKLIAPLKPEGKTTTGLHSYEIKHSVIVGKPASRLYVEAPSTTKKEKSLTFRIAHPSFEQFISLAPRTVTPIYSSYGATIVTLLDIHVAPPLPSNDPQTSNIPRLEILEAGTGNGGLTLHLARSIAAANPPPPYSEAERSEEDLGEAWQKWQATRRAVVHTVEFQKPRSNAAEKLIKSYRGALYWPHIDFHSGDVGAWVSEEQEKRRQEAGGSDGFLDIVILDLPAVHRQISHVVDAMKEDGQLIVWVPQITQVAACQQQIESLNLSLKLDQVVELGEGVSNGRRWNMQFVKTRAEQKRGRGELGADSVAESTSDESDVSATSDSAVEGEVSQSGTEFPTMICRPMVGELIMGGGFVGLWRKVTKPKLKPEEKEKVITPET